ncbi:hypothetical protein [Actinoplanes sp. NPDC023714]|uniref:hypothetical protein n=1 Tax=Actinoplanes sp. NPDC023714 TaxID=3154322 RepID=UPI0033D1EC95
MMYDYPSPMFMGSGSVLFVLLLLLAIAALGVLAVWPVHRRRDQGQERAEQILADRFAGGQIDAEEYEQSLRMLRNARH